MIWICSPEKIAGGGCNTFGFFMGQLLVNRPCRLLHIGFCYDFTIIFLPLIVKFKPLVLRISNICDTGTLRDMRPM